jgi:hypothetical protein
MSKLLALIAGASIIALAGTANAGGPVTLADSQMDRVTAGTAGFDFSKKLSSTTDNNVNFTGNSAMSKGHSARSPSVARARHKAAYSPLSRAAAA